MATKTDLSKVQSALDRAAQKAVSGPKDARSGRWRIQRRFERINKRHPCRSAPKRAESRDPGQTHHASISGSLIAASRRPE